MYVRTYKEIENDMLHEERDVGEKDLLSKVGVLYRKGSVWIINRCTMKKITQFALPVGRLYVFLYRCRLAF